MRNGSVFKKRPCVLAICGGGNAGHALAVIASQNFKGEVTWLASSPEKADLLRRGVFSAHGLQATGAVAGRADKVRIISSEAAEVIPNADVVMLAVPAYAHAAILKQIEPYLKEDALIGSLPTRSGFEYEATHIVPGFGPNGRRILFGLQTLPWSTRVQEPGKIVNFGAVKAAVLMATLPYRCAPAMAQWLSQILGTRIVPTPNFLNMTLGNPGQVVHPGLMYGFFGTWSGKVYSEDRIPRFYADATERIGTFVEGLSSEIRAIAKEIEQNSRGAVDLHGVLPIHDWARMSYPGQTLDTSTVASCFRTGPLQARRAPVREADAGGFVPNFNYRYLTEDVPFGLAVTKSIAQMVQVDTPRIDIVIRWAEQKLGKHYLVKRRLEGADTRALPIPQNYAITSLRDLIDWYANDRSEAAVAGGVGH